MRLDRYREVDEVLGRALDLPAEEREPFLAEACRERPETLVEVRRLLAADAAGRRFLEVSPADALDPTRKLAAGAQIGPYRIERLLGAGGMGVVYLATRADGQFERPVAIKLLGGCPWSRDGEARFRAERQILAGLEHPYVARLYDSGESETEGAYIVLEYVEGEAIDTYCDRNRLPVEARLRLFLKVLEAVGYAHQNLLVHRDLKPANILVGAKGDPKLIDFGISKQLERDGVEERGLTRTEARPMTPGYASPEQVRRATVGTASDLYSLGVVLSVLLCGERPYRLASGLPHELEAAILERPPLRPSEVLADASPEERRSRAESRAATPRQLARRLAGDLDTIVLKALAKEPQRRYATASELAADLTAYLQGRPVSARRDRLAYRTAKLVRRHPVASLGTVLACAAVLSLLGVALVQRARALAERDKAKQALAFLVEVFQSADPRESGGERVTAPELLAAGKRRLEELPPEQAEVRATLLDAIGQAELGLGRIADSAPALEGAYRLRRAVHAPAHDLAESLEHLGVLRLRQGRSAEAEAALRRAVGLRRSRGGGSPVELAESLNLLGLSLAELHAGSDAAKVDESVSLHREALALAEKAEGKESVVAAVALFDLARALLLKGDLAGAEAAQRRNLAIQLARRGPHHTEVATSQLALAYLLVEVGHLREAESLLRAALATQRTRLPPSHPDLITTLNELATVRGRQGAESESETLFRQVLGLQIDTIGERHPHTSNVLYNLAISLQNQGKPAEALALHERALGLRRELFGASSLPVAQSLGGMAKAYALLGRHGEAKRRADEALALSRSMLGPEHPEMAWPLRNSGIVLLAQDDARGAEPLLRQSLEILQRTRPAGYYQTAAVQLLLGDCLLRLGRKREAATLLREGVDILRAEFGAGDSRVVNGLRLLGQAEGLRS